MASTSNPSQQCSSQQQEPQQQEYSQYQLEAELSQLFRQPENRRSNVWHNYSSQKSIIVGYLYIAVAFLAIIFNAAMILCRRNRSDDYANKAFYISGGFWLLLFISGGVAIGAAKRKTKYLILANLVMSIVSTLAGLGVLFTGGKTFIAEMYDNISYDDKLGSRHPHREISEATMGILLVILSAVGMSAGVVSTVVCLRAVLFNKPNRANMYVATECLPMVNVCASTINWHNE